MAAADSSNDSGLIDSPVTIDNFGSVPWTLNNKLHKLHAYHGTDEQRQRAKIMAEPSLQYFTLTNGKLKV